MTTPSFSESGSVALIAEVGSVHDGSFGNAGKLIEAAAASGVDWVKFQTHIAEAETLASAPNPGYFAAEPRIDYFRRTAFDVEQWRALQQRCEEAGVGFLSSPFSLEAVDLLEAVGVQAYKVPSGEVTNLPLLKHLAGTGKPVLLSSGMSNWAELDRAVESLSGGATVTLMQCTSAYPCPPERVGLNVIAEMRARYGLPVGYSDHSDGIAAAIAAAALGACVIEKHFTFSRMMYGSDAANATEPRDFAALAQALKEVATMRSSSVDKDDLAPYAEMKRIFEKSVVTAAALPSGTVLDASHLAYKKPGDGISAARYGELLGRKTRRDLPSNHQLELSDLE